MQASSSCVFLSAVRVSIDTSSVGRLLASESLSSGPGSDANKGVLHIPQTSSITGTSSSDCLVSYPGHSLGESYPSAKMQLVYSTAPANWAC